MKQHLILIAGAVALAFAACVPQPPPAAAAPELWELGAPHLSTGGAP